MTTHSGRVPLLRFNIIMGIGITYGPNLMMKKALILKNCSGAAHVLVRRNMEFTDGTGLKIGRFRISIIYGLTGKMRIIIGAAFIQVPQSGMGRFTLIRRHPL